MGTAVQLNVVNRLAVVAGTISMLTVGAVVSTAPASAATKFSNCSQLNRSFSHGVGAPGARDKVSGSKRPVTNFRVDRATYNLNKGLDRDKDRIACEKK